MSSVIEIKARDALWLLAVKDPCFGIYVDLYHNLMAIIISINYSIFDSIPCFTGEFEKYFC